MKNRKITPQFASMATMTLALCFTATVSFVQFRLGSFRLIISPKAAQSSTNRTEKTSRTSVVAGSPFSVTDRMRVQRKDGMAVMRRCSFSLLFSTCQPLTGRDWMSQRFLPSRDTDGAVTTFMEPIRAMAAAASRGSSSSRAGSWESMGRKSSSFTISTTVPISMRKEPREQLSI